MRRFLVVLGVTGLVLGLAAGCSSSSSNSGSSSTGGSSGSGGTAGSGNGGSGNGGTAGGGTAGSGNGGTAGSGTAGSGNGGTAGSGAGGTAGSGAGGAAGAAGASGDAGLSCAFVSSACQTCEATNCTSQGVACASDTQCKNAGDAWAQCACAAQNAGHSLTTCNNTFKTAGGQTAQDLLTCSQNNCATQCGL